MFEQTFKNIDDILHKGAGRKCSICNDENLEQINSAIKTDDRSFRVISQVFFGSISKRDAIRRHAGSCLTAETGAKLNKEQRQPQKTVDIQSIPAHSPSANKSSKMHIFQRIKLNRRISRTFAKYRK